MSLTKCSGLLDIPFEIRLMIYEQLFETTSESPEDREQRLPHPLMAVCKQLRYESRPILMRGFQMTLSALSRKHFLDHYHLDNSDRLVFQPLVTTGREVWAYLPGILRSTSPLCVDVVNQIAQQLEHIVRRTARSDMLEESARLDRLKWNLMHPSTPSVASRELMLARLESIWAHHR